MHIFAEQNAVAGALATRTDRIISITLKSLGPDAYLLVVIAAAEAAVAALAVTSAAPSPPTRRRRVQTRQYNVGDELAR